MHVLPAKLQGEVLRISSKFRIKVDRRGGYYWILQEDRNYKTIAWSGESYVSRYNCRRAIDNVKGEVPGADVVED